MGYFDSPFGSQSGSKQPYGMYTPEDELTALGMAKGAAASGLELFSDILNTFGGRAIRGGILGGKPRELLSVLPFSDTLGITDSAEQVTGRDLAEKWGILPRNKWGDIAVGMGIDVLTDPTTYMFGPWSALTKGGQIAKAANILPATVRARQAGTLGDVLTGASGPMWRQELQAAQAGAASLLPETALGRTSQAARGLGLDLDSALAEPLGGLLGIGAPLGRAPSAVLGTGPVARQLANVVGTGTDWLGMTLPFRAGRAMFNKDVEGRLSQPLQEGFMRVAPGMPAAREAGERYGLNLGRQLEDVGMYTPQGQSALGKATTLEQPSMLLGQPAARYRADLARKLDELEASGVGTGEIEQYLPRAKLQLEPTPGFEVRAGAPGSSQGISPVSPHLMGRVGPYADIKGTGSVVDDMYMDPRIASPFRTLAQPGRKDLAREAAVILTDHLGWTPAMTAEYGALKLRLTSGQTGALGLTAQEITRYKELDKLFKSGDEWANILSRADPKYPALSAAGPTGAEKLPFYDPDVVKGAAQYMSRAEQVKLRAQGIMHAVGKDAMPATQAPLDWVYVDEVFKKINMTGSGAEATLNKMMQKLGTFTGEALPNLKISRSLANDLQNYITPFTRPTALDPFIKTWDTIQTIFKAGVLTTFPKKYVRDAVQGQYLNFAAMTPAEFGKYAPEAARYIKNGGVIQFANKVPGLEHLTPDQATVKLADEFASLNGFYLGKKSRYAEEIGGAGFTPKELPGQGREGLLEIMTPTAGRQTTWDPRDIAGAFGREETKFAPVVAGGKITELIEDTNKFTLFLQRRMNGYSPGGAWEDVIKRHYDYTNLSGFERSVMRKIVPFYSWMRQNVPNTLKRLVDQPGGLEAVTAKSLVSQRSEDFIPEYVGEGLAIPLSPEEGGSQRFLSRSGLHFEDALKVLGDIGNIKSLGNLTPGIKVPLEFATGTQLYTGRPLEDMQPITGNRIVDEILSNSGLPGRAYTTARPLLMPLKDQREFATDDLLKFAVNALSPASITDVDIESQKRRAVRQVIENELRGSRDIGNVERFYVQPENINKLTPEQLMLMRTYQAQQQEAARKRRIGIKPKRKSAAGVGYQLD